MSDNPRIVLAFFWVYMSLNSLAGFAESTHPDRWVLLAGALVIGPTAAVLEFRQGLRERKARKASEQP